MAARKLFYACAGVFLLVLSYYLGAKSARANARRIVTRELVVTDDAGRQRVTIMVDTGGPHISLSNEAGYPTVFLSGASLTDKFERDSLGVGHGPFGGYLSFFDPATKKHRARVGYRLELGPDGWPVEGEEPGIAVYGKDGMRLLKIWSAPPD